MSDAQKNKREFFHFFVLIKNWSRVSSSFANKLLLRSSSTSKLLLNTNTRDTHNTRTKGWETRGEESAWKAARHDFCRRALSEDGDDWVARRGKIRDTNDFRGGDVAESEGDIRPIVPVRCAWDILFWTARVERDEREVRIHHDDAQVTMERYKYFRKF